GLFRDEAHDVGIDDLNLLDEGPARRVVRLVGGVLDVVERGLDALGVEGLAVVGLHTGTERETPTSCFPPPSRRSRAWEWACRSWGPGPPAGRACAPACCWWSSPRWYSAAASAARRRRRPPLLLPSRDPGPRREAPGRG